MLFLESPQFKLTVEGPPHSSGFQSLLTFLVVTDLTIIYIRNHEPF